MINFLNPHPYLFWVMVGAPTTVRAMAASPLAAAAFIGSFYLLLVGSKILLAWAVGRSRGYLADRPYRIIIRVLGALLMLLALLLIRDGLGLVGIA
jgi:threonine/homoserine/homoserine lactone efflux protein